MPKARESRELSNDGRFAVVERDVKVRDKTVPTQYRKPVTFGAFADLVMGANSSKGFDYKTYFPITDRAAEKEMSEQDVLLNLFNNSLDKWAGADVYESVSGESTIVTIAGERLDLMTVPVARLIKGYNGHKDQVDVRIDLQMAKGVDETTARMEAEKGVGFGPWRKVARNLTEGYEKDGKMVAPAAKLTADGTLVAI